MLRKGIASIITLIMIFCLAGCGNTNIEMLRKLNEVSKWEAANHEEDIKLELYSEDEKYAIEFSIDSYSKNKEMQLEVNIIPKAVHINGVKIDLTSGEYQISPIKFYFDEFKFYLETKGIKEIYDKMDIDIPAELEPAYIGMDRDVYEELGIGYGEEMELLEEQVAYLAKLNVDLPVDKIENTYSININEVQAIQLIIDVIIEYYTMEDGLLDQFVAMGEITEEEKEQQIIELIAASEEVRTGEMIKNIQDMFKGSNLSLSFDISDNDINSKTNFDLKFDDGELQMGMSIDVTSKTSKTDVREIEFPKEVKLYTIEELMDEYYPSEPECYIIVIDEEDFKHIDGLYYLPAKLAFSQMGIELEYDVQTKQVFAQVGDEQIPIEVNIINGVSYIEAGEFEENYDVILEIR